MQLPLRAYARDVPPKSPNGGLVVVASDEQEAAIIILLERCGIMPQQMLSLQLFIAIGLTACRLLIAT